MFNLGENEITVFVEATAFTYTGGNGSTDSVFFYFDVPWELPCQDIHSSKDGNELNQISYAQDLIFTLLAKDGKFRSHIYFSDAFEKQRPGVRRDETSQLVLKQKKNKQKKRETRWELEGNTSFGKGARYKRVFSRNEVSAIFLCSLFVFADVVLLHRLMVQYIH